MGVTRYVADWTVSPGNQPPDNFHYDLVENDTKVFSTLSQAIAWVQKHDYYSEGKVYVEEMEIVYDDLGTYEDWQEMQIVYCYDDGTTETTRA